MTNHAEALAKALEALIADPGPDYIKSSLWDNASAALEAYRSRPDGWRPIAECQAPGPTFARPMFVVKAFEADIGKGVRPYTSDAYCVWREGETFVRWPHPFPPTHFLELPAPPNSKEQQ